MSSTSEIRDVKISKILIYKKIDILHNLFLKNGFNYMKYGSGNQYFFYHSDDKTNESKIERYHVDNDMGWCSKFNFNQIGFPVISRNIYIDNFIKEMEQWKNTIH